LPARSVKLSQSVSASDTLKVGEPVTRTVIVDAAGLEENMITPPPWPDIPDVRIYPDQPQGISRNDGTWVLGHKEFRYAVVPEKAGELVLPELKLQWWDTQNDREQTAVLPQQRLQVLPSSLAPPASPAAALPAGAGDNGLAVAAPQPVETIRYWNGLTVLFAGLWLATVALFFWRRPGVRTQRVEESREQKKENEILGELKQACTSHDAAGVRRILGHWLREFGPASASGSLLTFAAESGSVELEQALTALDAVGYRLDQDEVWRGEILWKAFSAWRRKWVKARHGKQGDVTDLYAS
jgi:hypothetical protein